MTQMSRRSFLRSASAVVVTGLVASALPVRASSQFQPDYDYPIPTAPEVNHFNLKLQLVADQSADTMEVAWEIATDPDFQQIVNRDSIGLTQTTRQALNIILDDVPQDTEVFYRLKCTNCDAYEIYELPYDQDINISNISLKRSDLAH